MNFGYNYEYITLLTLLQYSVVIVIYSVVISVCMYLYVDWLVVRYHGYCKGNVYNMTVESSLH